MHILKPLTNESRHKLQSIETFIDAIKTVQIPDDYKLVAFDVKSLFTSIPLQLALDCTATAIKNSTTKLPLPADDLMDSDEIDDFHEHLNRQNADIQFTKEIEENGKIPFLDCLVTHDNDNKLSKTVYRKPTHTDRLLDQSSTTLLLTKQQPYTP